MSIIYEQTPNGLYATGQRTVSTFPSGLIRVDQTFACKTSAAATHRATLAVGDDFPGDSYPAMDGLKIFPEPQERRRDDGFTEFTVSGYGRVKDTPSNLIHQVSTINYSSNYQQSSISNPEIVQVFDWGFSLYKTTGTICIPANSTLSLSDLSISDSFFNAINGYIDIGSYIGISVKSTYFTNYTEIDGTIKQRRVRNIGIDHTRTVEVNDPDNMDFTNYVTVQTFESFRLLDPIIVINTTRFFGDFKEIEFDISPVPLPINSPLPH